MSRTFEHFTVEGCSNILLESVSLNIKRLLNKKLKYAFISQLQAYHA